MKACGTVHKYGDNVDTDVIIPARYLNSSDPAELAKSCMEDIDPDFVKRVQKGDIMVANKNFGCGSSREHAPIAIKASGISCVIAETFARIFYRNAINIGLPIIECPAAAKEIEAGDTVEIDFDSGMIYDKTKGTEYQGQAFPEFMQKIIKAEGSSTTSTKIQNNNSTHNMYAAGIDINSCRLHHVSHPNFPYQWSMSDHMLLIMSMDTKYFAAATWRFLPSENYSNCLAAFSF